MISKVLAVAAVVAIAINSYHFLKVEHSQTEMRELFASWKAKYDKVYSSLEEEETRFANFLKSVEIITSHNSKKTSSFTMGLTKFSDLSHEEFSSIYANGLKVTEEEGIEDPYCPSAVNCPEYPAVNETYVNWTAAGAVTGIKNQGMCGSCWSFSTTGSLEGLYYLNNSVLLSFSEQQIIDCDSTCQACDGCWPYLALEYSAKAGNELETEYPYRAVQGKCRYVESLATKVNTGYKCVPQKNAAAMQSASVGQPVSIAVDAGNNAWQYYAGGVVDGECTDSLDHAVLLVGYGDWQNQSAWFVKNSWGLDWGANGYIYISQDATPNQGFGICGILRCGTIPINETSAI